MKKTFSILLTTLVLSVVSFAQTAEKAGLPELHTIKNAVLSSSYSCRTAEEFREKGYAETGLFLSDYSKQRNSPDLLFNGACGSEDYFEASTAGDGMSLVADLGENLSLEDVTASAAFNLKRIHSFAEYAKFAKAVAVKSNHAYAVLINEADKRGLFVFQISDYTPNKRISIRYAVKSYQITSGNRIASPGFDWEKKNHR